MALLLYNAFPQTVWVTFAYYDPQCGPANQNFRKLGWWQLDHGELFMAWDVDLQRVNRYAYMYGESANNAVGFGGTGNAWITVNPNARFNQCAMDNTNANQWVNCFGLDFAWAKPGWDLMMSFGPPAGVINAANTQGVRP